MEQLRKEFKDILLYEYKNYCKATGQQASEEGLICYMVNKNLVEDKTIKRFVIIEKYPIIMVERLGSKQVAIWELEDLTGFCSKHIRNIIKRFSSHFRHSKRLIP